jgi:hypothetical protein
MAKIYSFLSVSVCTNADTRDWARRAVGRSKAEYILATHQFSFIRPGFLPNQKIHGEKFPSSLLVNVYIAMENLHFIAGKININQLFRLGQGFQFA